MSILVMSQVWAWSKAEGSALLCELAIADFANDEGYAFPSIGTLAKKCRLSERSVQYAIAKLVEMGEVTVEPNSGPNGVNTYRVGVQNLRGANSAGVQSTTERGATGCTQTVINHHKKKAEKRATAKVDDHGRLTLHIDEQLMEEWKGAFPAIDVLTEVRKAEVWIRANPANTKSNWERFLVNWLNCAQDKAPRVAQQMAPQRVRPAPATTTRRPVHESWYSQAFDQGTGHVIDVLATPAD